MSRESVKDKKENWDVICRDDIYREAGDIEQDANLIINLWNTEKNKHTDKTKQFLYYIAKNRNGKPGGKYTSLINLKYLQIWQATPESIAETDKPGSKEIQNQVDKIFNKDKELNT